MISGLAQGGDGTRTPSPRGRRKHGVLIRGSNSLSVNIGWSGPHRLRIIEHAVKILFTVRKI